MATRIEALAAALPAALGDKLAGVTVALGEVTADIACRELDATMRLLRDRAEFRFEKRPERTERILS